MRAASRPLMALPMHVTPPTREEVEASAKASPLMATLSRLRDFLGPSGRQLSLAHGLCFENGYVLAEILGLPTIVDPEESDDDSGPLSPDPVPRCTLAFAVAIECGAIEEVGEPAGPLRSLGPRDHHRAGFGGTQHADRTWSDVDLDAAWRAVLRFTRLDARRHLRHVVGDAVSRRTGSASRPLRQLGHRRLPRTDRDRPVRSTRRARPVDRQRDVLPDRRIGVGGRHRVVGAAASKQRTGPRRQVAGRRFDPSDGARPSRPARPPCRRRDQAPRARRAWHAASGRTDRRRPSGRQGRSPGSRRRRGVATSTTPIGLASSPRCCWRRRMRPGGWPVSKCSR